MIPLTLLAGLAGGGWKKLALGLAAVILVAMLVAVAAWRGYRAGYRSADHLRVAEVAAIRADHAHALAAAEATARQHMEAAVAHATAMEGRFLAAKRTIAEQSRELTNQRIAHASKDVAADGSCRFGPEWVRLYNEAIGAGDDRDAVSCAAASPAGTTGTAQTADPGVFQEGATVNPEDILAHARDYGRRNRALEAQLMALIDWARGLNSVGVMP